MREMDQKGLETRSEAVYMDCVTDDGSAGFAVRLCRYPQAGFAWAWGHVFLNGRICAFTNHELVCDSAETDLALDPTRYALSWAGGETRISRSGDRNAPRSAEVMSHFLAHEAAHPPHGNGSVPCRIEAGFHAAADAVSNRAGRSEVLGTTRAKVRVGDAVHELSGRSQFHEQVQTDPRFTSPFSYLTLRGPDLGLVAIRGARGARGHLLRADAVTEIVRITLTPPGSHRALSLHGQDGSVTSGELTTTYDYSVPAFGGYRPGSLVSGSLGGVPVSGCVNDYLLDQLYFDRSAALR